MSKGLVTEGRIWGGRLAWMDRLGANYARLFVNTRTDLRDMLSPNFGARPARLLAGCLPAHSRPTTHTPANGHS